MWHWLIAPIYDRGKRVFLRDLVLGLVNQEGRAAPGIFLRAPEKRDPLSAHLFMWWLAFRARRALRNFSREGDLTAHPCRELDNQRVELRAQRALEGGA